MAQRSSHAAASPDLGAVVVRLGDHSRAGDQGAGGTTGAAPEHEAVLALQRAAGNRAVTGLLQRAPDEHAKDRSAAAFATTVAGAPPAPAGPAPTIASPEALGETAAGPPVAARPFDRTAPLRGQAVPVTDAEIDEAYRRNPASVIRSPSPSWHNEMYVLDKGTGGIPQAFRVGNQIAVHPDFAGPATALPQHAAEGNVGLGQPDLPVAPPPVVDKANLAGPPTLASVAPPARSQSGERAERRVGRPANWHRAVPVTEFDVQEAMRKNPALVIRSPSLEWHEEMYGFDEGTGMLLPPVYRVGEQIVVAPDHPIPAMPLPHYSADATEKAAKTIGLPGATIDEQTPGRSFRSTVTESGGTTRTRDEKREGGMITNGEETSTDGLTNRKERTKGVAIGQDGNLVGGKYGRSETSTIDEAGVAATSGWNVTGGLTADEKIKLGGERKRESTLGTRPDGTPDARSHATTGSLTFDTHSVEGSLGHAYTGPTGREVSGAATFSADDKGNASAGFTGGMKSRSGAGGTVTVSAGHTVTADEPEQLESGEWVVRFVVADSTTVGAGVSGPVGPVSLGVAGSTTGAETKTGTSRFATEKEALDFQAHAADRIEKERALQEIFPVTTVAGALALKVGESRGVGGSRTWARSESATAGATLSHSGQSSSGHELSVFKASQTRVHVTYTVTGAEGSDWGISGAGLTNQKGESESTLYAVTYEFDLASPEGAAAFKTFVAVPLPPASGGRRVSVRTLGEQESHDKYSLLGGSADWSGTTWQDEVVDDEGKHEKYGGKQSHNQTPGTIEKWLGDKEEHSDAQIVRAQENDQEPGNDPKKGARAEFKVSGESGAFNRAEFGKIFEDSRGADAAASGKWTLSAPVPMARIRELEAVSPRLRAAPRLDDKMKVYAELVKENGGRMLGGQVGISSKAWDLELKGDENFPGPAGREQLHQRRKALMEALRARPPKVDDVVREAGEELQRLRKRRAAVADPKRYTDLPDGLRKQQVALIDSQISEFQSVRRNALAAQMRARPAGTDADHGRPGTGQADRAYAAQQDRVEQAERTIGTLRSQIRTSSRALGDAIGGKGSTAIRAGVDAGVAQAQIAIAMTWIKTATEADNRQDALEPQISQQREAWNAAQDPAARAAAMTSLAQQLEERVRLMRDAIHAIEEAGKAVFPITTRQAMAGNPAFWQSLGMAEPEEEPAPATSMRL